MSKRRTQALARRAGIAPSPLAHLSASEYRAAIRGLSDRALLGEYARACAAEARAMTDEQLLAALAQAQAEAQAAQVHPSREG